MDKILSKKNNIKTNNLEGRNNTINIESIIFIGDNIINQYSLKNFNNINNQKNKNILYTPENGNSKNKNKEKNNFLKKFKISILCSNKKKNANSNSVKYTNNISIKLSNNKIKKKSKNTIYNYNIKKIGPLSFNNLIANIRAKKKKYYI